MALFSHHCRRLLRVRARAHAHLGRRLLSVRARAHGLAASRSLSADPAPADDGEALREDLALAYRAAARLGLNEGLCNHFTAARPPDHRASFLVVAHGTPWETCAADDLLEVGSDGAVLRGDRARLETTAFHIHRALHVALGARAAAVLHTHMPHATALCALAGHRLLPVHQNSCRFLERVAYDDDFGGTAQDAAEGARLCAPLAADARARVLMLRNHGVVVVGRSVAEAFDDLYYLERAARVQCMALQAAGGDASKLALIDDATARATRDQIEADLELYAHRHWGALQRLERERGRGLPSAAV